MSSIVIQDALDALQDNRVTFSFTGDPRVVLTHARTISEADDHAVCFFRGDDFSKYAHLLSDSNLLLVSSKVVTTSLNTGNFIVMDSPDLGFCIIAALLLPRQQPTIHSTAVISDSATIGSNVHIGAFVRIYDSVVISDSAIVEDCCVLSNTVIGPGTHIGPGVTIGGPGLGSHRDARGRWHEFPHFGCVQIGASVVIQDNTIITRGTLGNTIINDGVRIGPLCSIAHGVHIENDCLLGPCVYIAGSSHIGPNTVVWGQASIRDGITIGRNAVVGMGAVVVCDIPDGETWVGNPARRK